jgi:hypothetical protein
MLDATHERQSSVTKVYIVTTTERRACEWMFFELQLGKPRKEIDCAQTVERRETRFVEGTHCYSYGSTT